MKISEEIKRMIEYNFAQKEAVEELLSLGYTTEEIKRNIFTFYPKEKTDDMGPFLVSVIGQLLLIIFCVLVVASAGPYIFILVILLQMVLFLGSFTRQKYFLFGVMAAFAIAALAFGVISFSIGIGFFFGFALLASLCCRITYRVYEINENAQEQYHFG